MSDKMMVARVPKGFVLDDITWSRLMVGFEIKGETLTEEESVLMAGPTGKEMVNAFYDEMMKGMF